MSALELSQFGYSYPGAVAPALDGIDLRLDGGLVALLGDSGSGKSTLLRVCNGLVPHFHGGVVRGTARVFGMDILRQPTRRLSRDVGLLFQDPEAQSVYATVERDVAFGLENLGIRRDEMLLRVHDALGQTGISALRGRAVSTLSGGERQRLALAGLLAMQPRLLVLDEPLSQLDTNGAASFMDTVAALSGRDTSVLIAEHRVEQVLPRASSVLTIAGGCVQPGHEPANGAGPDGGLNDSEVMPAPAGRTAEAGLALHGVTAGIGGQPVVAGVDIVAGSEVVVLTGPNGSGKTTLLRTIAGLLPPMSGTVERTRERVAYLPQNPTALLHRPTVRAEIEWTLRHESASFRSAAVDAMLNTFALRDVASRYPRDLSSGQRQRAALAAVLAGMPGLALLDEPTRGMDRAARSALISAIRGLRARGGAVVLATHDRELAAAVADRVITLGEGAVREQPALVLA